MTPRRASLRFIVRAFLAVGIVAVVFGFALAPSWGVDAWGVAVWSGSWAVILAILGYRNLRAALIAPDLTATSKRMVQGILLRLVVVAVPHVIAFQYVPQELAEKLLLSTVGFYVVGLAIEVWTLNQELGSRAKPALPNTTDNSTLAGSTESNSSDETGTAR